MTEPTAATVPVADADAGAGAVVLSARNVSLAYWQDTQWADVLFDVSLDVSAGEIVGLVGESGCGKSSLSLLLLGYRHPSARVRGGRILFHGEDLLSLPESRLTGLRGNRIGFVPQNPTTSLNPGMRVGAQIEESLRVHGRLRNGGDGVTKVQALLADVGLPDPARLSRRFPHQLSGGQQQRVTIAMALACGPDLVVLDEPTTGLDVTTQKQIIALLKDLRERHGTAMLYVTHDLGVLGELADRICVMYAGHLVESAPTRVLFDFPRHPYTRGLIGSIPRIDGRRARDGRLRGYLDRSLLPPGCPFGPRCPLAEPQCGDERQQLAFVGDRHAVACRNWEQVQPLEYDEGLDDARAGVQTGEPLLEVERLTLRYGRAPLIQRLFGGTDSPAVVRDVSFTIGRAEVLALVGESGSGKSTIARAVSGLLEPVDGTIRFLGRALEGRLAARSDDEVRRIQFIFQNPDASLNPRQSVRRTLARPLEVFFGGTRSGNRDLVDRALEEVMLSTQYARRFPDQLSGGERQRVAMARALVAQPDLLLCDEVLSALDVSVQASVLDLLERLRTETSVTMLFISHDLAVVRRLADTVCVLYHGQLMETGPVAAVFDPPHHPYTLNLLQSVPGSALAVEEPPAPAMPAGEPGPAGCAYAGRCPWQPDAACFDQPPPQLRTPAGGTIRCHLPLERLATISRPTADPARRESDPSPGHPQ